MAEVDLGPDLEEAASAYRANRLPEARATYAVVADDRGAAPRDRAVAARELARIAWLAEGDDAAARTRLSSAEAWLDEPCLTAALLVRVLREAGHSAGAAAAALRPHEGCTGEHDELAVHEARAWADLAVTDRASVSGLSRALDSLSDEKRHGTDAGRLELELGLVSSDAGRAFDGWVRYFWLDSDGAPQALRDAFPEPERLFERALAPSASLGEELDLARLLVRAGFHRETSRFARVRDLERRALAAGSPAWPAIAAYLSFRNDVERLTLVHNRRLARGDEARESYAEAIAALTDRAAGELSGVGGAAGSSTPEVLLDAWGLYWTVGLTGGFMSLHAGHVVEDVEETVEQDGRVGAVRRLVLDNMLANGYESWLWDGWAQAGGWAEDGARLVQVRPSYVDSIVDALRLRPGRPARARADAGVAALAERDATAVRQRGLADLPGLAERLRLQAIDGIVADLAAGEHRDDATAFQSAYWDALVDGTITIHEGRHVLDQAQFRDADALSSDELEYRAKLSELRFALQPRIDLAKLVVGQIGGDTGHGRANTRILGELGRWTEAHATTVDGFDPRVPAVVQVDRLTDEQIRAFASAADPASRISMTRDG